MAANSENTGEVRALYSDIEEEQIIEQSTQDPETGDLPGPDTGGGDLDEATRRRLQDAAVAELNRIGQTERPSNT